jgi:hypothetical protein
MHTDPQKAAVPMVMNITSSTTSSTFFSGPQDFCSNGTTIHQYKLQPIEVPIVVTSEPTLNFTPVSQ